MNRVTLLGNVGTDPRTFDKDGALTMVTFRMATTQKLKGEERTQWHNIKVLDKSKLNVAAEYIRKGSKLLVSGMIDYREYEKDGQKVPVTEIVLGFGSELELLTWPEKSEGESGSSSAF